MNGTQRFFSRYGNWFAVILLLIFFGRLLATAQIKSATFDETLHVFQGALYWQNETLYSVVQNPPLVNSVIGFPLALTFRPVFPENIAPISNWLAIAKSFMWEINNKGLQMLAVSRLAIMWLAVLLGALVYRWSGQLFSARTAGLLALLMFSFDPNILAHSYLASTDLGTAFFYTLAGYLVWQYWRSDSSRSFWGYTAAGTAMGLTLAAKFSGLVIIPAVISIAIYKLITERARRADWWRTLLEIAGWLAIGALVFLLVYRFNWETLNLDFSWQREHQLQGQRSFLLGEFGRGWWYYFPLLVAIKTPIASLLLLFLSVALFLWRRQYSWQSVWLLLLAGGVFAASMISRVNIGYRYLLPMLPPLAIFIGQLARPLYIKNRVLQLSIALAIISTLIASVTIHPHYLAYFNALAGGPDKAWRVVVDSNIDWGQDLQGLAEYMDEEGFDFVNANWLGSNTLEAYGINGRTVLGWPAAKENPLYDWFYPPRPAPGFYAFSVTQLQGLYLKYDKSRFAWFRERQPLDKIGYSLFVYDVPATGNKVGLAISGIGIGTIEEEDFDRAFKSNDVQPRWFDARSSLLWPGGNPDGGPLTVWSAIGSGHLPRNSALQALYPENGPAQRNIGAGGFEYVLYQWPESPVSKLLASENANVKTHFGWSAEPTVGSGLWDQQRLPLQGPAVLGDFLELKAYQPLWVGPLQAGENLEIMSFWEVANSPQEDIKLFLHLLDKDGQIVAQHDGFDFLVRGLRQGDELVQLHTISLPEDLEPGEYGLQIGAYRTADSTRLLLEDNHSDRILLDKYSITE